MNKKETPLIISIFIEEHQIPVHCSLLLKKSPIMIIGSVKYR